MPYKTNKDLPDNIKSSLPDAAQTIWKNVFNSTHEKTKDEDKSRMAAWGAVKNAGYIKGEDGKWKKVKKAGEFQVMKVDSKLGIVFGYGMISKTDNEDYYDSDNQHIPEDIMLKSTTDFMEGYRINNNDHSNNDVGKVIHSFPLTKEIAESMGISARHHGWIVGVKPDKPTLKKFADGTYKGFSIEGSAIMIDEEGEDE